MVPLIVNMGIAEVDTPKWLPRDGYYHVEGRINSRPSAACTEPAHIHLVAKGFNSEVLYNNSGVSGFPGMGVSW